MMYVLLAVVLFEAFCYGLSLLFEKAGQNKWLAFIPGYNFFVWMSVIKKPWWWVLILIFPGVNIIMFMTMCVQTVYCFNRRDLKDALMAMFIPFVQFPILGKDETVKFVGPPVYTTKNIAREWIEALVFAVIAASIIRGYFLEAFTIPTSSMEKTLLKGDFLFVSKINYGPKIPNTPLSFPFAHHTMPGTNSVKSYLDWIKLPYYRLPGFQDIKRNDMVVFNFPEGDTVIVDNQNRSYYQVMREEALKLQYQDPSKTYEECLSLVRKIYWNQDKITVRPVDKCENYIKRCVGMPGDKLFIKDAVLHINDKPAEIPAEMQFRYMVKSEQVLNKKALKKDWDINPEDVFYDPNMDIYYLVTSPAKAEKIKALPGIKGIMLLLADLGQEKDPTLSSYPNDTAFDWTQDNFGPMIIPQKGMKIELNTQNIALYRRAITAYENHSLQVLNGQVLLDGLPATHYTFTMNYYWLMGDNRHNSLDSRFWGFVPEDHVVGKAVFIWASFDPDLDWSEGKIRWNRFFRLAHQD